MKHTLNRYFAVWGVATGCSVLLSSALASDQERLSHAGQFHFDRMISREVLENYLSRSITMEGLLNGRGDLDDNIRMLKSIGAKFIGRSLCLWGGEANLLRNLERAKQQLPKVHTADPDMILQACIFEIVTTQVEQVPVPGWAFAALGLPVEKRNFRYADMLYPNGRFKDHWRAGQSVPDVSRTETQLWFYFLGASFIDLGIEAIHFGQTELMNHNDRNLDHYAQVLTLIRSYAAKHARRHIVLCDSHVPSGGLVRDGQLLMDFHSFPLRIMEAPDKPQEAILKLGFSDGIYGRSKGGTTPSGWKCEHLPFLVEIDNWGVSKTPGQPKAGSIWIWGYDEITWFAHQSQQYRSNWLHYAWDWVRKTDANGHLQMPGSRTMVSPLDRKRWYYANTPSPSVPDGFGDEEAIRALWAADSAKSGKTSQWVWPGPDGMLSYKTTAVGDRIMDFSHAGYMGGGVALPVIPVKRTLQPSGAADDTAAIQAAIDAVATLPVESGFRGAVQLAPGTFTCSGTITIPASGVVLRGSGCGADGGKTSTIKMTGKPHLAIAIRSPGGGRSGRTGESETALQNFKPVATTIADAYLPAGASSFGVSDATGFAVGDTIEIRRPVTTAWIQFMEMHNLVRDGRPQTWIRAGATTATERRIAAVAGNRLTLDVPLSDSFDAKYLHPPGTVVARIQPPVRLSQAGIEDLHVASPPQAISHSQPHFTALRINGQDCWARDLVIEETMNSVGVSGRRITLQRVAVHRKALHQGSSRPAEFAPNASQVLLDRCSVNADNVWYVATGGGQAGPMVLLNCTFHGNGRAESHQRWSTEMLYDNCRVAGGGMDFRNRGSMGSGHGWSMGWGVAWNCVAEDFVIQNPPGAANWMIGCAGRSRPMRRPFGAGPNLPEGIVDAHGTPVDPPSLYLAQLAERLGPQAVKNLGY